eukprot:gene25305-10549_t
MTTLALPRVRGTHSKLVAETYVKAHATHHVFGHSQDEVKPRAMSPSQFLDDHGNR